MHSAREPAKVQEFPGEFGSKVEMPAIVQAFSSFSASDPKKASKTCKNAGISSLRLLQEQKRCTIAGL
ncbi:hypothetical protein [Paenibacillus alba]|uniref:Uncharacterized protein n=1 Tax=Paenibacillus alba TaxID=1197127 RepID=A0ABU6G9K2_9BACL|nr:hypothetical protein [Paenibacillus alba]MEC0230626.1 hypothetical protein [Paenibacillus alba]